MSQEENEKFDTYLIRERSSIFKDLWRKHKLLIVLSVLLGIFSLLFKALKIYGLWYVGKLIVRSVL